MRRTRLSLIGVLLAANLALPLAPATAGPTMPTPATAGTSTPGCASPLLAEPRRASTVEAKSEVKFDVAVARNARHGVDLPALGDDDGRLWLDRCGIAYYTEPVQPDGATGTEAGAQVESAPPAGVDPLNLASKPGASRTIYLDFDGETVTGTAWNSSNPTLTAEPFSRDMFVSTDFSDSELWAIYETWQVVAEDYAPFDVNVTTKDPGAAAIDRTDAADTVFGTRVLITNGGPLYDACGCGGQAYVNVFSDVAPDHAYYQPAWVYSDGLGSGWSMGQAASHESGHNFGLSHHGTSTRNYYSGSDMWAPIMGVSYYSTISQWSHGEYPDANQPGQDDLAIIAGGAPTRTDDHGNTHGTGSPLGVYEPVDGVIETRTDVDSFEFTAGGPTTLRVAAPTDESNLDVELTILDSTGAVVTTINPIASIDESTHPVQAGFGATWQTTLPSTLATYTALVDGVGSGDPMVADNYSDYGSLGRYQVHLSTNVPPGDPTPLTATFPSSVRISAGQPFSVTPVTASGGTAPYTFTYQALPSGVTLNPATGVLSGTMSWATGQEGVPLTITVTDARGAQAVRDFALVSQYTLKVLGQHLDLQAGGSVSAQLDVDDDHGYPVTWTALSSLPPGLGLGGTGRISGAPTRAGSYTFDVQATTETGTGTGTISVTVATTESLSVPDQRLDLTVGIPFDVRLKADGALSAPSWRANASLPPGLSFNSSGTVTGTPTQAGTFLIAAIASTPTSTATGLLTIAIAPKTDTPAPPSLTVATTRLPKAHVKTRYKATVALHGATPGTTWKVRGTLPKGLTLKPKAQGTKAIVVGTPARKGTYTFKVKVRDRSGHTATNSLTLKVGSR